MNTLLTLNEIYIKLTLLARFNSVRSSCVFCWGIKSHVVLMSTGPCMSDLMARCVQWRYHSIMITGVTYYYLIEYELFFTMKFHAWYYSLGQKSMTDETVGTGRQLNCLLF